MAHGAHDAQGNGAAKRRQQWLTVATGIVGIVAATVVGVLINERIGVDAQQNKAIYRLEVRVGVLEARNDPRLNREHAIKPAF